MTSLLRSAPPEMLPWLQSLERQGKLDLIELLQDWGLPKLLENLPRLHKEQDYIRSL